MVRMNAKSDKVNEIAKELAMHLDPMGKDLVGIHVWSECNVLADALSRVETHGVPEALATATQETIADRSRQAWRVLQRI